ncbi:MaoC family dehydratase [Ignavigranum ruoffiae]|uniref:3-hydroxybutyryl-CoA dehydratase n=1 Tax=Ignavigranum ruoffiae TaxID=89093 RepID=A0A1H9FW84_9LACT|nr:MaoC family dehydratase [Ignavigranum ruoffiae]UPQ85852.1 MaoC family dehydratase [Ignavigranum ruoffiae]SEQ42059.1 3-hydroxybutyryl-CoA dehydratase [Ignavigranum ruoffiae]
MATYEIGQSGSFTKTITEADVVLFAGVSGDLNPAHVNEVAASQGMFKKRIAHGMLGASLISAVLGMHFPGPGTIYLGQNLKFVKPVAINDTLTATVKVTSINDKGWLTLDTTVTNQDGDPVIKGEANVIPPK